MKKESNLKPKGAYKPKPPTTPPRGLPPDPTPMNLKKQNKSLGQISKMIFGDSARLEVVDPKTLKLLKENARFMKKESFRQLVNNLKADRRLSSVPLCHIIDDKKLEVLSGNHRVEASIAAGLEKILVIVLLQRLTNSEKIAIQLSHNALVGEDDKAILANLWGQIEEIQHKLYAGISSETVNELEDIKMVTFSTPAVATKSVSFVFSEEEKEKLDQVTEELSRISAPEIHLFPMDQFDEFFKLVQKVKVKKNIKNGSMAMVKIIEIVEAHLQART